MRKVLLFVLLFVSFACCNNVTVEAKKEEQKTSSSNEKGDRDDHFRSLYMSKEENDTGDYGIGIEDRSVTLDDLSQKGLKRCLASEIQNVIEITGRNASRFGQLLVLIAGRIEKVEKQSKNVDNSFKDELVICQRLLKEVWGIQKIIGEILCKKTALQHQLAKTFDCLITDSHLFRRIKRSFLQGAVVVAEEVKNSLWQETRLLDGLLHIAKKEDEADFNDVLLGLQDHKQVLEKIEKRVRNDPLLQRVS